MVDDGAHLEFDHCVVVLQLVVVESGTHLEVDHGVVVEPEDELRLAHGLSQLAGERDGVPRLHVLLPAAQYARLLTASILLPLEDSRNQGM